MGCVWLVSGGRMPTFVTTLQGLVNSVVHKPARAGSSLRILIFLWARGGILCRVKLTFSGRLGGH